MGVPNDSLSHSHILYCSGMDIREGVQRKIDLKRKEVAELELKIREQQAYIRAMEDTLRLLDGEDGNIDPTRGIRTDSDVGRSREALKKAGKPLHISELVKAIGKADDKRNKISLAGTLSAYVRDNKVFTRPLPNTYGLMEFSPCLLYT